MSDTYSALHSYVATALAGEMNVYIQVWRNLEERSKQLDNRGNPPPLRHSDRASLYELRIKITILAAVYVEALVNLYLSFKLTKDQFSAIDRLDLLEKWATIPSLFVPGYMLPRSESTYGDLKVLITHRNSVAHMKPEVSIAGEPRHEGNLPKQVNIHQLIQRWDSLPARLIDHLRKFDMSLECQKFKVSSAIDDYANAREGFSF